MTQIGWGTTVKSILIGACAVLFCGPALAQGPSEFAAADAKLKACVARDSSNMHIMACNQPLDPQCLRRIEMSRFAPVRNVTAGEGRAAGTEP